MRVKVSGLWRETGVSLKVSGTWRSLNTGYVRVAGVWRKFYDTVVGRGILLNTYITIGSQNSGKDKYRGYFDGSFGSASNHFIAGGFRLDGAYINDRGKQSKDLILVISGNISGLLNYWTFYDGTACSLVSADYYPAENQTIVVYKSSGGGLANSGTVLLELI